MAANPAMRAGSWQGSRGEGVRGTPSPDDAARDRHSPPGAAAFFDLDKTLMEGSSAFHFARASYRAGQISKRQLARDAWANPRFRLQGSTDEATEARRERVYEAIAGRRVVALARLTPEILAGILPRV